MKYIITILVFTATIFLACENSPKEASQTEPAKVPVVDTALTILNQTIDAHGGSRYDQAHYSFLFRKKKYTFQNQGKDFRYTVDRSTEGAEVLDTLDQSGFTRMTNGVEDSLTQKQINGYTGSLNSVIYFATLPHKLLDPAVNVSYTGTAAIKGENYDVLEVNFNEEGGGTDHDDEFCYWINKETRLIDYLAYNYQVNKGGVRFRSAYNTRNVDGIVFQDYVNYKAPLGTPLIQLPVLFEQDSLEELSLIETEDVVNLKH